MPSAINIVEDLPALPDSVPPTPVTTAVGSDASGTPKAIPSAGAASQYLQPFVEDAPEQPSEVQGSKEPPPPTSVVEVVEEVPTPIVPENSAKSNEKDNSEPAGNPTDSNVKVTANDAIPTPEIPNESNEPAEKLALAASPSQTESTAVQAPPPSVISSVPTIPAGAIVPHQHFHPAHGFPPQPYAYHHPPNPYAGYPGSQDTNATPVSYQQSPGFPPLLSYSPIPTFAGYASVHSMSMIPTGHPPHQYQQTLIGPDYHQPQGPPARNDRAAVHAHERKDDENVIRQVSDLLPDIIRLVTNDRREKAEMKAMRSQYEKVIETITADRNALRHDIAQLRQKADLCDGLTADNVRLISEKQSLIQDLVLLKDENVLLLESRDVLRKINTQHESTVKELKDQLEAERRSNDSALEAARSEANRKVRLADEATSKLRSEVSTLMADRNKQIAGTDESTIQLRSELTELRNDRNNRIKDYDNLKKEHMTKMSQFEARIKDLEDTLDKTRKTRVDDSTSRPLERSTSVSSASGRDMGSRNAVGISQHEGSAPAPARRPNLNQGPASHRLSLASQYFQSSNASRSTTSDRLPGGYDYYDETPKGEPSNNVASRNVGASESGRTDHRN